MQNVLQGNAQYVSVLLKFKYWIKLIPFSEKKNLKLIKYNVSSFSGFIPAFFLIDINICFCASFHARVLVIKIDKTFVISLFSTLANLLSCGSPLITWSAG